MRCLSGAFWHEAQSTLFNTLRPCFLRKVQHAAKKSQLISYTAADIDTNIDIDIDIGTSISISISNVVFAATSVYGTGAVGCRLQDPQGVQPPDLAAAGSNPAYQSLTRSRPRFRATKESREIFNRPSKAPSARNVADA